MKVRTAASLRVGRISYINTLPFYQGLAPVLDGFAGEIKWASGTPAEINRKMRRGELDLAPISSLEYLLHQDRYLLIPGLCIGSRDFSGSVLLISRERPEGLNGRTISLTQESLSAAALLKILLKFKYEFENQFRVEPSNPLEMLANAAACLVIGDQALFFRPEEFFYKTDLSELWWEWTRLPFCFSVWAVRKDYYREHAAEVENFCQALRTGTERNLLDLERLLREGLNLTMMDEKFPMVFGYLFNLTYSLDEGMQEGLLHFYRLANQMDLAPAPGPMEFIEGKK